jgi:uncharacterized membrane-anchored protein YitT (DUF2179 family)
MKRYLNVIMGCIIIGLSFNLFFVPYDLVPNGIYGMAELVSYKINYDPGLFLIIVNVAFILICLGSVGYNNTKKYLLPSLLIPVIILLSSSIVNIINFDGLEKILITISGSFLMGYGYSLIFKEGFSVGGIDLLQDIFNSVKIYRQKTFSYIVEALIVIATVFIIDLDSAIYSLIAIVIIKYMATKSKVGISNSKTFFIITDKEKEVKEYIINELNHDLTEFNVKGGFSNNKSKILMTSIDTKEYYRLKEGIGIIDSKAFISIVDSYEVINKNRALKKHQKNIDN